MKRTLLAGALALVCYPVWGQTYFDTGQTIVPGYVPLAGCTAGGHCTGPASSTNPLPFSPLNQPPGTAAFTAAQPTVSTSGTLIIAARTGGIGIGRVAVTLVNQCSSDAFLGPTSGVTTSTGGRLKAGASVTLDTTAAVYGVVATGTCEIDPWETY